MHFGQEMTMTKGKVQPCARRKEIWSGERGFLKTLMEVRVWFRRAAAWITAAGLPPQCTHHPWKANFSNEANRHTAAPIYHNVIIAASYSQLLQPVLIPTLLMPLNFKRIAHSPKAYILICIYFSLLHSLRGHAYISNVTSIQQCLAVADAGSQCLWQGFTIFHAVPFVFQKDRGESNLQSCIVFIYLFFVYCLE